MKDLQLVPHTKGRLAIDPKNKRLYKDGVIVEEADTYDLTEYWSPEAIAITIETIAYITIRKIDFPSQQYHLLKATTDSGELEIDELYLINDPIESFKYKGYYHIAHYEGYVITRDGRVKHNFTGKDIPVYTALRGRIKKVRYNQVSLSVNSLSQRKNVGRYRALALAFSIPPSNPGNLDVNHIDGNSMNDDLSNLEWVTRQQNAYHAYSTGLRDDNKFVLVKNIETGEITEHFSIGETARIYNSDPATIYHRCNNELRVYEGKYLFKYKTDKTPWPTKEEELRLLDEQALPCVIVYDVYDDTIVEYKSSAEASKHCRGNIVPAAITKRANGVGNDKPLHGYHFYRKHRLPEALPKYSPLELEYIKYCDKKGIDVKIGWFMKNLETGETKIGNNTNDVRDFTGKWLYQFYRVDLKPLNGFSVEKIFCN